ncbi:MAG TPA: HEPN domain-containing protein [Solirubrobacteraceae bacterium]
MASRSRYRPSGRTEVQRLKDDLDALFVRADDVDPGSEVEADLNRYLCVRISGFLERALASVARVLCEQESFNRGQTFGLSWLGRTPNPRSDEIVKLVRRFDIDWAVELEEYLGEFERYSRINALLGIRNDIAHGRNQGMSRSRTWEYYELVSDLVDWLLERFDPLPTAV